MYKWFNKLKNKKGFTLIELIVVLAVLGIIAIIAIPRFLGIQEQSRLDADAATVESLVKAAELHAAISDTNGDFSIADLASAGLIVASDIVWQSSSTSPVTSVTVGVDGTITINY